MDRHTGKLRESHLRGALTLLYGVSLLDVLWSVILLSLVLRPYVVYPKVLPCTHVHLSARMDSSKEASGTLTSPLMGWHPLPFLIPKESFCAYVIETTSLTLRIETYVISFSLLWAGPSSSLPLPLPWSESVHWRQCSGVYPVPFVIYIWKCKQEAGCKCLT